MYAPRFRSTQFKSTRFAAALAVAGAGVLAGCASPMPNAMLAQAHADYASATSDSRVVSAGSGDLQLAREALQHADAAEKDKKEPETVNHYAYLVSQRVAAARQSANLAGAESAAAVAASNRDRIVLAARTREADQQRDQAVRARQTAAEQASAAEAARQQAASASSRAADLSRQLADMNAKQTQRGLVLTLGDVLFNTAQATLNPGAYRTVDQLAQFLKQNPDRKVEIEGYTDSIGSDAFNQHLSENRAASVKSALVDRGIESGRIDARGLGESNPVATNSTEAGRQQNRRIEIVVSNPVSS